MESVESILKADTTLKTLFIQLILTLIYTVIKIEINYNLRGRKEGSTTSKMYCRGHISRLENGTYKKRIYRFIFVTIIYIYFIGRGKINFGDDKRTMHITHNINVRIIVYTIIICIYNIISLFFINKYIYILKILNKERVKKHEKPQMNI